MRRTIGHERLRQASFYKSAGVREELALSIATVFNFVGYAPRHYTLEERTAHARNAFDLGELSGELLLRGATDTALDYLGRALKVAEDGRYVLYIDPNLNMPNTGGMQFPFQDFIRIVRDNLGEIQEAVKKIIKQLNQERNKAAGLPPLESYLK